MKRESIFELVYRIKPELVSYRTQYVKAFDMMHAARIIINRHNPAKVAFKKVKECKA